MPRRDDASHPHRLAVKVAAEVYERGHVTAAQPNFTRVNAGPSLTKDPPEIQWGLNNPGNPGVVGADVAASTAWTISAGRPDVRVAVLDDGIQAAHPALQGAVVAQRNFVDKNADGTPTDDAAPTNPEDYHGTACAGIIASRNPSLIGLAHDVSLVACRIGTTSRAGWLFVVKPSSGRGEDALRLANRLAEKLKPQGAQVHFVVITPPPASTQGGTP